MKNRIRKSVIALFLLVVFSINASEKVYIDEEELKHGQDAFYIHTGGNVWVHTDSVHRDKKGLYTYEASIVRSLVKSPECPYEKTWKCPYCYNYWPIGTACQNPSCPSKYKMNVRAK